MISCALFTACIEFTDNFVFYLDFIMELVKTLVDLLVVDKSIEIKYFR